MATTVSVVTGGAGGMGLITAKIVGRDNFVVICDVNRDRLATAAAQLEESDVECRPVFCDITDKNSVADLVAAASAVGPVASVIHTAGVSPSMGAADLILRINAVGTVNVNEAFLPLARDGFSIVNVASMAAHMVPAALIPTKKFECALREQDVFLQKMMSACRIAPQKLRPGIAYSLSKSFVVWYCKSQAARFGRQGARILSVSPGAIDTAMGRLEEQSGAGAMIDYAALQRFGKPEEIAELLAFCASEKASYLTGIDILCDGGVVSSMTLRDKLAVGRSN
jgi:NAD(P)-dependent dehydrogenase (short-subunit alcohol dehydrogenase family)